LNTLHLLEIMLDRTEKINPTSLGLEPNSFTIYWNSRFW